MKRKSMREIRLEEYTGGFYHCLEMFESAFRKHFWKQYHLVGPDKAKRDPKVDALWSVIEKAQKEIGEKNNEYKVIMMTRRYGNTGP